MHATAASGGVGGGPETGDRFGGALAVGDFDADNTFDLVAGVPSDSVAGVQLAGAANIIHGSHEGLREDPDQLWSQATRGVLGTPGADALASGLASGSR